MPRCWPVIVCLLLIAGCAQSVDPLPLGERPARLFEPQGNVTATIIAVHGFNDHSRAFEPFGRYAAARGYFVDAYDQNGFGKNPNFGEWPGQEALVRDLIDRIRQRRHEHPERPLFVIGESMGAAISILALAGGADKWVDGLVMSAPAVWGGEAMNPFYRGTLWLAARIAPNWTFSGQSLGVQASDNLPMLRELGRDPLYIKDTPLRSIQGLVELMGNARQAGATLKLPRLLLGGLKDQVVPPEAILSFAPTLKPELCRRIIYDNGWHLLLRDLNRRQVWDNILLWMNRPRGSSLGTACDGG